MLARPCPWAAASTSPLPHTCLRHIDCVRRTRADTCGHRSQHRARCVCAHPDPLSRGLHIFTLWGSGTGRGWPGPLAFLSSICSPRNPDTSGNETREKAEMTLTLPAEPECPESEAGEKLKRPFR